jgi:hypothetical protein
MNEIEAPMLSVTHVNIDPLMGTETPTTHSIETIEWPYDEASVTNALMVLFRRFRLPSGGTMIVEGYGKRIEWEHDGFLVPLARKLLC